MWWCRWRTRPGVFDMPEDAVTGIKVKLRDEFQADQVAGELQAALRNRCAS